MAFEPPPNEKLVINHSSIFWDVCEKVFMVIYSLEMCLKVGAYGLVVEKFSYLRDPWNVMDFLIVLSSWFTIVADSGSISMIRTVRLLRTLRTLRTI
jgi:hypothetical protein